MNNGQADLDDTDRILLACLQSNARTALDRLAEATGLSAASVQRRLKRLRQAGVIEREIVVVDPIAVGQTMSFIVLVELERERLHELDAFRRKVRAEPQVQQTYYITGEADFALVCTARDMANFEELTHRLFFEDRNVRRFRTSVVMDRTKVGLEIPSGIVDPENAN
ncbi:Lrp/AsnC family transcriptional regulator [Salinisphaera sp. SWV1]|uniref:Lrp/AsnC family transcriptional regulator n=1 Tax=Salinisphaera sp. SWV1 TaxID=3454139 RepID=UPI003F8791E6